MTIFRDIRDSSTGILKIDNGRFAYACPRTIAELKDPRMREYFAARLRGEPVSLPRSNNEPFQDS